MKFLKWLAALSGILAGVSLFIVAKEKRDKENQELDEYLMSSAPDDVAPMETPADEAAMVHDIYSWKNLPESYLPVVLSFGFSSLSDAENFQAKLSQAGYSSGLDNANLIVDMLYQNGFTQTDLSELADVLSQAAAQTSGQYQGFHFHE